MLDYIASEIRISQAAKFFPKQSAALKYYFTSVNQFTSVDYS